MKNKVLIIIFFFLISIIIFLFNRTNNLQDDIRQNENLIEVLNDSVRYHQDKFNREVASKKALVTTVKELQKDKVVLTDNQNKLLKEVKQHKKLKVAVQVKEKVVIRDVPIVVNDTVMVVDSIDIENEKSIVLKEVKGGTEVYITNSNPLFKTVNVDALYVPTKKKWYNRKGFKMVIFGVGVATGVYIGK